MIDIQDIDSLPVSTEFNVTDLLVKVNRGGGPVLIEKVPFSVLQSALSVGASDIDFTPAGDIIATDVQAAIEEIDGDIDSSVLAAQIFS